MKNFKLIAIIMIIFILIVPHVNSQEENTIKLPRVEIKPFFGMAFTYQSPFQKWDPHGIYDLRGGAEIKLELAKDLVFFRADAGVIARPDSVKVISSFSLIFEKKGFWAGYHAVRLCLPLLV